MNTFKAVLLLATMAACSAGPAGPLEQDFSITDEQGGYHFGYNDGHQARQEQRTPEGVVRGETQTITYTADQHNGFLASGTNIPKVPETGKQPLVPVVAAPAVVEDTPEVKAARAEHLEAHKKALIGRIQYAPIALNQYAAPIAIQYTPEVAAARAQHLYSVNQQLYPRSGYLTYPSQPAVRYIIQGPQYHPDYLPYAAL